MDFSQKAAVSMAIEETLLNFGGFPLFDEVNSRLYKRFNSSIAECYTHPNYLTDILKEMYGNAHVELLDSVVKKLSVFDYDDKILNFVKQVTC